jgi:hypothetical protein
MIYIFNRNWVDTRWQQYTTHLNTNNTHNTDKEKFAKCRPCPVFASYTLAFTLQLRKNHGKVSVRGAQLKNNEQYNTQKNMGTEDTVIVPLRPPQMPPLLVWDHNTEC